MLARRSDTISSTATACWSACCRPWRAETRSRRDETLPIVRAPAGGDAAGCVGWRRGAGRSDRQERNPLRLQTDGRERRRALPPMESERRLPPERPCEVESQLRDRARE